jgi:hypothetical protein
MGVFAVGEDRVYDTIVNRAVADTMTAAEQVVALRGAAHDLVSARNQYLGTVQNSGIRGRWFGSADYSLLKGGDCGHYVAVLTRLLHRAGFEARIAQMLCEDTSYGACHIVVEANLGSKWVVLDPLYDHAFRAPDGTLASYAEVSAHWDRYVAQVPPDYRRMYSYNDVRYTNWSKFPVLMPAAKTVLGWVVEDVETVSIRAGVLNLYRTYAYLLLGMELVLLVGTAFCFRRRWTRDPEGADSDPA